MAVQNSQRSNSLDRVTTLPLLSVKEFYDFVLNRYPPSPYESNELKDGRFLPGTYYSHLCRTRCCLVYQALVRNLVANCRVVDLGAFPGTLIRELKMLLEERIHCYAVGLKMDDDFRAFIAPYVECSVNADFDPFYSKSQEPVRLPFEKESFDAVVATEILEHLVSPLEMIAEGARILRRGGLFIVTTPNVS